MAIRNASGATRAAGFVILGVIVFMMKRACHGPQSVLVASHLGNVSISFAVYFLAAIAAVRVGLGPLVALLASVLAVESFELCGGFGLMANTYDPWDLLANAIGIGLAGCIDAWMAVTSTLRPPADSSLRSE